MSMKNKKLPPIHPGEILIEEFLNPMGISLGISPPPPVEDPDRFYRSGGKKYR
jgi:hypothetical protein